VDVLCLQIAAARLKIVPCYLSLLARVFQQTVKPQGFKAQRTAKAVLFYGRASSIQMDNSLTFKILTQSRGAKV
jgi:hypothetical protein